MSSLNMFKCPWSVSISRRFLPIALLLGALSFARCTAVAHETDNFYLPLDAPFADIGDFLDTMHTAAIEEAVAEANAKIERAGTIKDPAARAARIREYHNPEVIVSAVGRRFGAPITETYSAEKTLRGSWGSQSFPGKKVSVPDISMNFTGHSGFDPRKLVMLSQSDTVKAFGVYFGTDKITHFHTMGWSYYKLYQSERRKGLSSGEAYRRVLRYYAESSMLSESNIFGTIGTGVYSNADMCVNHLGFRFYQNLTEKVVLKGQERQPLVVRAGSFWRVNQYVRPHSGWFGAYVSDHWNEALLPSLYDPTMRARIRKVLTSRADHIVKFYTQVDRRPNNPAYFEDLARKLSTYYGENYAFSGQTDQLMNIGNTCYPALRREPAGLSARPATSRSSR